MKLRSTQSQCAEKPKPTTKSIISEISTQDELKSAILLDSPVTQCGKKLKTSAIPEQTTQDKLEISIQIDDADIQSEAEIENDFSDGYQLPNNCSESENDRVESEFSEPDEQKKRKRATVKKVKIANPPSQSENQPAKKKRGRPRKNKPTEKSITTIQPFNPSAEYVNNYRTAKNLSRKNNIPTPILISQFFRVNSLLLDSAELILAKIQDRTLILNEDTKLNITETVNTLIEEEETEKNEETESNNDWKKSIDAVEADFFAKQKDGSITEYTELEVGSFLNKNSNSMRVVLAIPSNKNIKTGYFEVYVQRTRSCYYAVRYKNNGILVERLSVNSVVFENKLWYSFNGEILTNGRSQPNTLVARSRRVEFSQTRNERDKEKRIKKLLATDSRFNRLDFAINSDTGTVVRQLKKLTFTDDHIRILKESNLLNKVSLSELPDEALNFLHSVGMDWGTIGISKKYREICKQKVKHMILEESSSGSSSSEAFSDSDQSINANISLHSQSQTTGILTADCTNNIRSDTCSNNDITQNFTAEIESPRRDLNNNIVNTSDSLEAPACENVEKSGSEELPRAEQLVKGEMISVAEMSANTGKPGRRKTVANMYQVDYDHEQSVDSVESDPRCSNF